MYSVLNDQGVKAVGAKSQENSDRKGDIARTLGVSRGYISNIENGKTNPTLATIARLAKAVKATVDELVK